MLSAIIYGLLSYPNSATERVDAELRCLALTVYHESRGEPDTGSAPQRLGHHLFYRASGEPLAAVAVAPEDPRPLARKVVATGVVPETPALRLPEATKTFLLELRVTMMIYVSTLRDRAVRINDTMYRQGDELAPGLTLASITSTAIVVRYQDRWFRFPFV